MNYGLSRILLMARDLISNSEDTDWFKGSAECRERAERVWTVLAQFQGAPELEQEYIRLQERKEKAGNHAEALQTDRELEPVLRKMDGFVNKLPRIAGAIQEFMNICFENTRIAEKIANGELVLESEIEQERQNLRILIERSSNVPMPSGEALRTSVIGNYIRELFPKGQRSDVFFNKPKLYREKIQSIEDAPYRDIIDQAMVTLASYSLSEHAMGYMEEHQKSRRGKAAGS